MKDRLFDKLMFKKFDLFGIKFRIVDIIFMLSIWVMAWIVRIKMIPIESADYFGFLEEWMDTIRYYGGFKSLKYEISNYTSPYMYLMCLVSVITDDSLKGLKFVSYFFDYAASIAVFIIVFHNTGSMKKSLVGMTMLLFSPAVILDGAYWCQCDIIYSCLILYAFVFFYKKNSKMCMIMIGLAFSFKLQTLFVVPFLIIMWLKKDAIRIRDFIWIPVMYVVMNIPAYLFGRPLKDLMSVYFSQSGYYPWGTLKYPNMYYLLDETMECMHHSEEVCAAGVLVCIAILGVIAYYFYVSDVKMNSWQKMYLSLILVATIVYVLPHMHDRYGFLADIFALVLASMNRRKIHIFAFYSFITIFTYMPYLLGYEVFPLKYVAVFNGILLVYMYYDFFCNYEKVRELSDGQ